MRCAVFTRRAALLAATLFVAAAAHADAPPDPGEQMNQAIGSGLQAGTEGFSQFSLHDFKMKVRPDQFKGFSPSNAKLLSKEWYKVSKGMQRGAARVAGSGAFRFTSAAMAGTEAATDVVARAAGGDFQGATAGAAAIASGQAFIHGASVVSGMAGSAIGAAVGTAVPLVNPIVGECIGGAVGKVAGGVIAAVAYDLLFKSDLTSEFEATLAPIFDQTSARVRALQEQLRLQTAFEMKPLREAHYTFSTGFGHREVQLDALPTLFLRPAVPSGTATRPEATPELIALTSFDAVYVSSLMEVSDGSSVTVTREEIDAAGTPFACYVLSVRDGRFALTCDHTFEYPEDQGVSLGHWVFKSLGVIEGAGLVGTSLSWMRTSSAGKTRMSDGEVLRHVYQSSVAGKIYPDGRVVLVEDYIDRQNWNIKWDTTSQPGRLINTGEWQPYSSEGGDVIRSTSTYQVDSASLEGHLLFPALTAQDIDAMEFNLSPVFFQHGVSPPQRVR